MRRMGPLLLIALSGLLLPSVSAEEAAGELTSDSPVVVSGSGKASGDGLAVYHHAFRKGSLGGRVDVGRLFDHSITHVAPNQDFQCDQFEGKTATDQRLNVNATQTPWTAVTLDLDKGSLSRLVAPNGLRFSAAPSADPSRPFGMLGPSPYHYQSQQMPPSQSPPDRYAPAFPNGTFLLAPTGKFTAADPLTLEVHWGNLIVVENDVPRTFEAGVREETRSAAPPGPLPGQFPVTCEVLVTHVLLFDLERHVLDVEQSDLDQAQAYWAGEPLEPVFADGEAPPPFGYWDRTRAGEFAQARQRLRLPATSVSTDSFRVAVSGQAVFEHAVGGLAVDGNIREAHNTRLSLAGNLLLEPTFEDDEGRRMKTQVGNEVTDFVADRGATERGLGEYAPYIWGAIGGVGAMGLAYFTWPHLKFGATQFALLPLYARLKKEDILENPLRDDILEVVNQSPGISASELGRRLSCGWGTLVYHLTVLERMQLISSAREGRHKRFFVQGRINYSDKGAASLIANPAAKTILDAVRDSPGTIQRDLSRRLGLSAGTVAWHVDRLESAGLIVKEEEGRVVRYYPSTKLLELTRQMAA